MELKRRGVRAAIRLVLVGTIAYYAVWAGEYSWFDLRELRTNLDAANADIAQLRVEADSLRTGVTALEEDPSVIERVARERYGMIRDGETLYRFVPARSAGRTGETLAQTP